MKKHKAENAKKAVQLEARTSFVQTAKKTNPGKAAQPPSSLKGNENFIIVIVVIIIRNRR